MELTGFFVRDSEWKVRSGALMRAAAGVSVCDARRVSRDVTLLPSAVKMKRAAIMKPFFCYPKNLHFKLTHKLWNQGGLLHFTQLKL